MFKPCALAAQGFLIYVKSMWKPEGFFDAKPLDGWGTTFKLPDDSVRHERQAQLAEQEAKIEAEKAAESTLLDKDGLAAKLLACAEEKIIRNGQAYYTNEAKDRLGFLKLYAEVMGFAGKALIDASTTFTNNEMKVVLVRSDTKEEIKTIKAVANEIEEPVNVTPLRIKAV